MAEKFAKSGKNVDEIVDVMKHVTRPGISSDEVVTVYKYWANAYDEDLISADCFQSKVCVNEVVHFLGDQRNLNILDVAAGTGMIGKYLQEKGFTSLDAVDVSAEMLEIARQTGVYNNIQVAHVGKNKLDIPTDHYDAIVTNGSFVPGHLNEDCFEELARIIKKDGYIFIFTNLRYFTDMPEYSKNLEPRMLELEQQGLWRRVLKKTDVPYTQLTPQKGVLFILQKC